MDYKKHYRRLIKRARNRALDCYTERHHVKPCCMGGGNAPKNIVRLTPEEHFVAHQLLVKLHPENDGVVFAAIAMTFSSNGRRVNNKRFGWLRRKHSLALQNMSEASRAKLSALQMGNTNALGRKMSEKQRILYVGNKNAFGYKHTAEWRKKRATWKQCPKALKKMSRIMKGNQHALGHKDTPEQSAKRSAAQKERRAREKTARGPAKEKLSRSQAQLQRRARERNEISAAT